MRYLKLLIVLMLTSSAANADIACTGTIKSVYKWNSFDTISIMLTSTNRWISMPSKSDESMALLAFASGKPVEVFWGTGEVTSCTDGWSHNRKLVGYFAVNNT